MKKLAIIRSDSSPHKCPFGLSIKNGCANAGNSVLKMTPLDRVDDDEQEFQLQHNIAVYALNGEGKCLYADQMIDEKDVVNCDFGDGAAGIESTSVVPAKTVPITAASFALTNYSAIPLNSYWEEHMGVNTGSNIYGYASLDDRKALKKQVNSLLKEIVEQESK